MKSIVILYHADCPDGFSAAWAASKKFGKRADYLSVDRVLPLPKGLAGKTVYSVDFTHSEPQLSELLSTAARVVFIDHHITAKRAVKRGAEHFFDIRHSGAVLAWKYFHPRKPVPMLLRYIEDMDLWRWRLPASRAILSYLNTHPFRFSVWDKLARDLESTKGRKRYEERGKFILGYKKELVARITEKAYPVRFEGYRALAVNSPLFRSEVGNALVGKGFPVALIWYQRNPQIIRVSLRSNGRVNVARIAEKYGGGGHKAASAFTLPVGKLFPWKTIK